MTDDPQDLAPDADAPGDALPEELKELEKGEPKELKADYVDQPDPADQDVPGEQEAPHER